MKIRAAKRAGGAGGRARGIALVITLIMLAVTLVMAVAFLAVARRETGSVDTQRDSKTAQLAAETAVARAQAQIAASMLASLTNGVASNAYNLHLFVSTNYINPRGFNPSGGGNLTNVNYAYDVNGNSLSVQEFEQVVSNLYFLPRPPVFVATNSPTGVMGYDFRYYLDLNENGSFEPNGWQRVVSDNPSLPFYNTNRVPISLALAEAPNILSNFMVGDPEWVGILDNPSMPHGANNQFIGRYAFIALPAGNALDVNYIHNAAWSANSVLSEGFMRNQGVGTWELNLAGFLADLNTNVWSPVPLPDNNFYRYGEPYGNANQGLAFRDAQSLLSYRYASNTLAMAPNVFAGKAVNAMFPVNNMDNYSRGPLQTNLEYYRNFFAPPVNTLNYSWSGAPNTNHYFALADWLDGTKTRIGLNSFTNDLRYGGTTNFTSGGVTLRPTYDAYTFYRMLDEIASDSSPEDGKVNLNYSNAVVSARNGVVSVNIIPGAETNLLRWQATNFFLAAADQMLRTYSSYWYSENPVAYTNTFGITNSFFTISNIPVWVSNRFVYTPAVNRLLQLAANIYDASTNNNFNLPHVYRPIFKRFIEGANTNIYITGYIAVNSVGGSADRQLARVYDITEALNSLTSPTISDGNGPVNIYGVPWIIGAKKGLPNFNQFSLLTGAQVIRKLEVTRDSLNTKIAHYGTNQAYIIGITNQIGVTFWNSYTNAYPRPLTVVVSGKMNMYLTNAYRPHQWQMLASVAPFYFATNYTVPSWSGSRWSTAPPNAVLTWATIQQSPFLQFSWPLTLQNSYVYNDSSHNFLNGTFEAVSQLDQLGLVATNYLQAYILDGNNVIDYVQLRDPVTMGGLNQALADPNYSQGPNNAFLQWSTNAYGGQIPPNIPYGVVNQIHISEYPPKPYGPTPAAQMPPGGAWSTAATPMGVATPDAEAAFFRGFFTPSYQYNGKTYINRQLAVQAPYTPIRTVYSSFLLQANDPLVHYLSSDLNSQVGAKAVWANRQVAYNGVWTYTDDPVNNPIPTPPISPVLGRYQPWGDNGQLASVAGADGNPFNVAYKDAGMWSADYWDFPTNMYPAVGWLGRVHRGTPWQTVYLKSTNVLGNYVTPAGTIYGATTWTAWTGNIRTNYYSGNFDAVNAAPQQDYLLFDVFTTRYNDNAVRGSLPVNVGMGRNDGGLAAWSALFSGMTAITNTAMSPAPGIPSSYTYQILSPAGVGTSSPLWQIVNGPAGINATRANTNLFRQQVFTDAGQILATPALTVASPFLNATNSQRIIVGGRGGSVGDPRDYGLNDEEYEWLPQQMMGLVRGTEQRYVLYCFGQALRPAPNGMVLSGGYSGLITNYQVTAESTVRAVIRVDNANTTQPRAVVESYNVLPPY